jgi:hypothetical protein
MKAIGITMVDLQPATGGEAMDNGCIIGTYNRSDQGYIVTYTNGSKHWAPKDIADNIYFHIADEEGDTIKQQDIENFIDNCYSVKIGTKNTNTTIVTKTGFEVHGQSGCVKVENFDLSIGEKYAKPKALDQIWFAMGFVLQWAKYGLNNKSDVKPKEMISTDNSVNNVYRDSLLLEVKELGNRFNRFVEFLKKDNCADIVGSEQYKLMNLQREAMYDYITILNKRIELIENSDNKINIKVED